MFRVSQRKWNRAQKARSPVSGPDGADRLARKGWAVGDRQGFEHFGADEIDRHDPDQRDGQVRRQAPESEPLSQRRERDG